MILPGLLAVLLKGIADRVLLFPVIPILTSLDACTWKYANGCWWIGLWQSRSMLVACIAASTAVHMSCDSFHFRYNLLLIGMSVGLSGCVTCRWFAVVTDLICAVWHSQLLHALSNLFVSLSSCFRAYFLQWTKLTDESKSSNNSLLDLLIVFVTDSSTYPLMMKEVTCTYGFYKSHRCIWVVCLCINLRHLPHRCC